MAEQDPTKEQPSEVSQPGVVISPGGAAPEPEQTFAFHNEAEPAPAAVPTGLEQAEAPEDADGGVSWTASEFIAHEKSASWYLGLAGVTIVLVAIIYALTRDYISSAMVLVGAILFGIMAARKPRQLNYQLDSHGITIGPKRFTYEEFRSFAVVPEGAFSSIVLLPLRRFATITTIYYSPEDEDKIVRLLASRLPFDEHRLDVVDNLMRRIRF